jgi:uncharacterized membrane protein YqhA
LRNFLSFLWSHRKIWQWPIIAMLVVVGILFAVAMAARVVPLLRNMM